MITNDVGTNRSQSLESNGPILNERHQQLQQKQIVTSLATNGPLSKVSVTKPIINLVNSSKLTTRSGGLPAKERTVLHLSSLSKTGAPSNTASSQPSEYSNSQQMTDGLGSLCSIGSAVHKALSRNLSTPILSTTKLSNSNSSSTLSSKYFLTQSSESSQPTSITLTSIQTKKLSTTTATGINCKNQPGVNTLGTSSHTNNNNNKNKSNSFITTHLPSKNDSIVLVPGLSLKTSGTSSPPQQQQALIDDQTVSSSFSHQNYLQFICSSAAQSPPSSLSSSENCSGSDDSLTMLDDSLTSLQWLQNLNILKSADSAMNNSNAGEQTDQQQAESNQGDKSNSSESKAITIKDEATELDLDSAVIPAATNQKKLSCLTKKKSIDSALNSTATATTTGQKVEYLKQSSLPAAASKSLSQPKQTKRNGASKQKQAAANKQTANLSNTQFFASTSLGQSTDLSIISINAEALLKEREEFRTNSSVKPPYSYSQLIILAMKESACVKMTLQMIYDWIIENFSYFKKADPSWQITFKNSIRHNLSLNKCFKKIARQKDEPGKGGFWTLDPDYEKQLTTDANKSNTSFSQQLDNPAAVVQDTPNKAIASDSKDLSSETEPKVTKRRRNGTAKVTKAKKNKKDKSSEQSNEFKQSPDNNSNNGKLSVKQPDYGYQYNLHRFSVNQPQILSPTDIKPQFVDNNNNQEDRANSAKKFKSNDMYMPMSHNHNSKITHRTSSPNSSSPSLQANSQQRLNNNNNHSDNRMFYDSSWNSNNQNLITHSLKPIDSLTYNTGQQQQNQMINQDYNFQADNSSNYSPQQQTVSQNHTFNSNCISRPGNYAQANQMTLNMTNFDDSLAGFNNHQSYSPHNQTINPRCINTNNPVNTSNTGEASGRKFSNQSGGFGCGDSHGVSAQVALPPVPSASAMVNTVEDMTGTFSSQFAHEIIKSMDDGSLFSFEENLVCNFDIDQLDETTSDFNSHCLSSSLLNTNSSYNKSQHHQDQNHQHSHHNNSTSNVDEFVNEFLKITSSTTKHQLHQQNTLSPSSISNSPPSSASCSSSNNSHFNMTNNPSSTSAFNAQNADSELIELFEYTSHFNMDEDTTTSSLSRSSNFINTDTHYFVNTNINMNNNNNNSNNNLGIASTALSSPRSNTQLDLTIEGHGITQPKGWMPNDPHHRQIQSMILDLKEVVGTTDSNSADVHFNNMLAADSIDCDRCAITSTEQLVHGACGSFFMDDLSAAEPAVVNDNNGKHAKKRIYTHNKDRTNGPSQKRLNSKLAREPKTLLPAAAVLCKDTRPKKAQVVKSKKVNELILN